MKTIDEVLDMIKVVGKSVQPETKLVCAVCWHLANHIKQLQPSQTDTLISETQRIIDHEKLGPKRVWALQKIGADIPGPRRNCLEAYMRALKWIGENETVEAWPLTKVPTNGAELQKLLISLGNFEADQRAQEP